MNHLDIFPNVFRQTRHGSDNSACGQLARYGGPMNSDGSQRPGPGTVRLDLTPEETEFVHHVQQITGAREADTVIIEALKAYYLTLIEKKSAA